MRYRVGVEFPYEEESSTSDGWYFEERVVEAASPQQAEDLAIDQVLRDWGLEDESEIRVTDVAEVW